MLRDRYFGAFTLEIRGIGIGRNVWFGFSWIFSARRRAGFVILAQELLVIFSRWSMQGGDDSTHPHRPTKTGWVECENVPANLRFFIGGALVMIGSLRADSDISSVS